MEGLIGVVLGMTHKRLHEMSMALGARTQVNILLQAACTYMCRHIYYWSVVDCDVELQIDQTKRIKVKTTEYAHPINYKLIKKKKTKRA